MTRNYPNPAAFRQALKARIQKRAKERGMLFNRYRQLVLFERFAARVYEACDADVAIKGGLGMELRFDRARTTRDIDAAINGDLEPQLHSIRRIAAKPGDDWLNFQVGEPTEHEGEQIVYEAYRVDVQAQIGGKPFGDPFHFDISLGEGLDEEPEHVCGTDLFEFIGIEPLEHRVYPREVQVAEKLHAWSLPRARTNSRVKDLVDLALMADGLQFEYGALRVSIEETFEVRDTHPVPPELPDVPEAWFGQYMDLRDDNDLPWASVEEVEALVDEFLGPVLDETAGGVWEHNDREWSRVSNIRRS